MDKDKQKVVLFKHFGKYAITSEENYNSQIMNGHTIVRFTDDCTKQEAIDTVVNWGIVTKDEILDMTGEL